MAYTRKVAPQSPYRHFASKGDPKGVITRSLARVAASTALLTLFSLPLGPRPEIGRGEKPSGASCTFLAPDVTNYFGDSPLNVRGISSGKLNLSLHPLFKVAAFESLDISEANSSKVSGYPFALTARDYLDPAVLSRFLQQEVTGTSVNREQAVPAQPGPVWVVRRFILSQATWDAILCVGVTINKLQDGMLYSF
jgi:hypothetical protein